MRIKETIKTVLVAAALGAATIGGSLGLMAAKAEEPKDDQATEPTHSCLFGGNYDSRIVDRETLILSDRRNNSMLVKVKGCGLNDFDPLLMVFRGTTQICDPIDIDLSSVSTGGFQSKCFVQSVKPLPRNSRNG